MDTDARALLCRMLQLDPARRATAKEALVSPYLARQGTKADAGPPGANILEMMKEFARSDRALASNWGAYNVDALQADELPAAICATKTSPAPRVDNLTKNPRRSVTAVIKLTHACPQSVYVRQGPQLKRPQFLLDKKKT